MIDKLVDNWLLCEYFTLLDPTLSQSNNNWEISRYLAFNINSWWYIRLRNKLPFESKLALISASFECVTLISYVIFAKWGSKVVEFHGTLDMENNNQTVSARKISVALLNSSRCFNVNKITIHTVTNENLWRSHPLETENCLCQRRNIVSFASASKKQWSKLPFMVDCWNVVSIS